MPLVGTDDRTKAINQAVLKFHVRMALEYLEALKPYFTEASQLEWLIAKTFATDEDLYRWLTIPNQALQGHCPREVLYASVLTLNRVHTALEAESKTN
jgi:hypothetical protein